MKRISEATRAEAQCAAERSVAMADLFVERLASVGECEDYTIDNWEAVAAQIGATMRISAATASNHLRCAIAAGAHQPVRPGYLEHPTHLGQTLSQAGQGDVRCCSRRCVCQPQCCRHRRGRNTSAAVTAKMPQHTRTRRQNKSAAIAVERKFNQQRRMAIHAEYMKVLQPEASGPDSDEDPPF